MNGPLQKLDKRKETIAASLRLVVTLYKTLRGRLRLDKVDWKGRDYHPDEFRSLWCAIIVWCLQSFWWFLNVLNAGPSTSFDRRRPNFAQDDGS